MTETAPVPPKHSSSPARFVQGAAGHFFSHLFGDAARRLDIRSLSEDAPLAGEGDAVFFESPDVAMAATVTGAARPGWSRAVVLTPDPRDIDPAQQLFTLLLTREALTARGFAEVSFIRLYDQPSAGTDGLEVLDVPAPVRLSARLDRPLRPHGGQPLIVALFDGGVERDGDLIRSLPGADQDGGALLKIVVRDAGAGEEAATARPDAHILEAAEISPAWLVARADLVVHAGRRAWMKPYLDLAARDGVPVREAQGGLGRVAVANALGERRSVGAQAPEPEPAESWVAGILERLSVGPAA